MRLTKNQKLAALAFAYWYFVVRKSDAGGSIKFESATDTGTGAQASQAALDAASAAGSAAGARAGS